MEGKIAPLLTARPATRSATGCPIWPAWSATGCPIMSCLFSYRVSIMACLVSFRASIMACLYKLYKTLEHHALLSLFEQHGRGGGLITLYQAPLSVYLSFCMYTSFWICYWKFSFSVDGLGLRLAGPWGVTLHRLREEIWIEVFWLLNAARWMFF